MTSLPAGSSKDTLYHLFRVHGLFGALLGIAFCFLLVVGDIQGLGTLLVASGDSFMAVIVFLGFAVSFSGAAMATSVLFLSEGHDDRGHTTRSFEPRLVDLRIRPVQRRRD